MNADNTMMRLIEEAVHFEQQAEQKRLAAEQAKIAALKAKADAALERIAPFTSLSLDELRAVLGDFTVHETVLTSTATYRPRIVLASSVIPGLMIEIETRDDVPYIFFDQQKACLHFDRYEGGNGRPAALRVILWAQRWNEQHPAMEEDDASSLIPFESELS